MENIRRVQYKSSLQKEIRIEIFLIEKRYIYFHEIYFETRNNFLKYYFFREIIGRKTSRIENIS